jgi:uncharacterized membrane protein YphA (DoxX/SURF4 family)
MGFFQSLIGSLGRLCLSAIFLIIGINVILDWNEAQQRFINMLCDWLALSVGNEQLQRLVEMSIDNASLLLMVALCCAFFGSLLLLLGLAVRFGALLLLLVLVPATVLFYPFWTLHAAEREAQMILFIKNIGIVGGLLLLLAYGCGGSKRANKEKGA